MKQLDSALRAQDPSSYADPQQCVSARPEGSTYIKASCSDETYLLQSCFHLHPKLNCSIHVGKGGDVHERSCELKKWFHLSMERSTSVFLAVEECRQKAEALEEELQ